MVDTNAQLEKEDIPLKLASYCTVWTMLFQTPGRYHWILQYYLKDEGAPLFFFFFSCDSFGPHSRSRMSQLYIPPPYAPCNHALLGARADRMLTGALAIEWMPTHP